jgi:soluble lytic murein transglycosylase-like protein
MRSGAPRSTVRVTLGALVFAAVLALPGQVGDAPGHRAGAHAGDGDAPSGCLGLACETRPKGWVERVDAQLALRMPVLGDGDRRRIARTLVRESEANGIDPLLVLALIQIESRFDPAALSERGARGLMQLREPTLLREVEHAGLDWESAADPAVNVQAGIRYLRRLLDAFGGEEVALMAYNAGPNRILAYVRQGAIPDRFRVYPRKVNAELRRLRRSMGPYASPALASARTPALPE